MVGGTGFYLRALLEGLFPGPVARHGFRARLALASAGSIRFSPSVLRRLDDTAAARIHPHDTNKLIRAIEVSILGRKPISEQFQAGRERLTGYRVLKIGLAPPRDLLNQQLDKRLARMFEGG